MKKIILLLLILFFVCGDVFAYAIKLYDEYGNRIGTYRKEGEEYVLYDFNDKKVENPEELIQNAPTQKYLKDYEIYFYNQGLVPFRNFSYGMHPTNGFLRPSGPHYENPFRPMSPPIIRPATKPLNFTTTPNVFDNRPNLLPQGVGASF